ncbi:mannitol dehydrogenase family protein [Ancylobacter defluvii]|uniref:Mannitol 2-dehydrogenase n=1 Tax=Ancylobacter defluvii TaxID=1282440 RepID=A0A9W6JZN3_9HYPH|nr:mannitol dehydrogenase family protein [Ancylobacter defluvii]MBS7588430.1 mannitol dehydrogenase family protein [Ancylobacter defluvii]GLK86836.1 mannitol 2-dehydrogenase [Ancylobacter defluvii]
MTTPAVSLPSYDRSTLTPGIVHIGLGNFHRAHQAVYLDELFARGEGHDWAIIGAGVRPTDARMREALKAQDYLSTVIELDPSGKRARRVGAMIDFLPIETGNAALIAAMAQPEIRIVSLTVTEGGYFMDPAGQLDTTNAEIAADAANPTTPETAFGAILAALKARRENGIPPFTIMSCDNLPGNGDVTRQVVVGLARLFDAELAEWVAANVAFPNGMVDRITPATGERERAMAAEFGLDDPVPVTCEPFRQWVLEDRFPAGRPALEKAGVIFTEHVHAYETMKIRILNGGHAIIAYPGGLMDIEFVHEAMEEPLITAFLDKLEREEIIPIVPPVPDTDLGGYYAIIRERFSNPEVADTVRRLCLDGSNRQPKFIVPSILDNRAAGRLPKGLILASALWCRYCAGTTDSGAAVAPNDPSWDELTARAIEAKTDPTAWLAMREVYGDVAADDEVVEAFAAALEAVWEKGARAVLAEYVRS